MSRNKTVASGQE